MPISSVFAFFFLPVYVRVRYQNFEKFQQQNFFAVINWVFVSHNKENQNRTFCQNWFLLLKVLKWVQISKSTHSVKLYFCILESDSLYSKRICTSVIFVWWFASELMGLNIMHKPVQFCT